MKYFLAVLVAVCLVTTAWAAGTTPLPPANGGYGGGWGMNPTNWNATSGSWSSWGLYNPDLSGGGGWVVGWNPTVLISYDPITIELWVEMYALQTYHYTSYQFHRVGNAAENICFTIEGLLQSNEDLWLGLTHGIDPLSHLIFRHANGVGDGIGANLPITWTGRYGQYSVYGDYLLWGWAPLSTTVSPGDLYFPDQIPISDHWFQFKGCFDLPYHVPDGYYSLAIAGCPAPEM
jgi:hypothetical protein